MVNKLRYIMRDGEKVLQQFVAIKYKNELDHDGVFRAAPVAWDWQDVLLEDEVC